MKTLIGIVVFVLMTNKAKAQSFHDDSLYIVQLLAPYKIHLKKIARDCDLLTLLSTFSIKSARVKPAQVVWVDPPPTFISKQTCTLKLPEVKYSGNEIIEDDGNTIAFQEIQYDLHNRNDMACLKEEYYASQEKPKKIKALINYIVALNHSYPTKDGWTFASSKTINKYLSQINHLFTFLPNDTIKSQLKVELALALNIIDPSIWRNEIYSLYSQAEIILLKPYWKILQNKKVYGSDTSHYKTIFRELKITDQLYAVLQGMYNALSPELTFNVNNQLYPFKVLKNEFLTGMRNLLMLSSDSSSQKKFLELDQMIMQLRTDQLLTPETVNMDNVIKDIEYVCAEYFVKLLDTTTKLSSTEQVTSYYGLGVAFSRLGDYETAIIAFYKAIQEGMFNPDIHATPMEEWIFFQLSYMFKSIRKHVPSSHLLNEVSFVYGLYESLRYNNYPADIPQYFFQRITSLNFEYLKGKEDSVRNIALTLKNEIVQNRDRTTIDMYLLALLYNLLLENNWLKVEDAPTEYVRSKDSLLLYNYISKKPLQVDFDGNKNIAEQYSRFQQIRANAKWEYQTQELKDEIKEKLSQITELDYEKDRIEAINNSLQTSIAISEAQLLGLKIANDTLQTKNETLQAGNKKLNDQNKIIREQADSLKNHILDLQNQASTLVARNKWLTALSIILLVGVLILIYNSVRLIKIRNQKRKEIALLNKQIVSLEETAVRIDKENKENNYKLKAENAQTELRLLTSLAVDHDIDGFIKNLPQFFSEFIGVNRTYYIDMLNKFVAYHTLMKNDVTNLNSNVAEEIELARNSLQLYLFMAERKNEFQIETSISKKFTWEGIMIPKTSISTFIANSIKHGSIGMTKIKIQIKVSEILNGYQFTVDDDGNGFKNLDLELHDPYRGINLAKKQFDNFNSVNEKYSIVYDDFLVTNKVNERGVKVLFKLIRKNA